MIERLQLCQAQARTPLAATSLEAEAWAQELGLRVVRCLVRYLVHYPALCQNLRERASRHTETSSIQGRSCLLHSLCACTLHCDVMCPKIVMRLSFV